MRAWAPFALLFLLAGCASSHSYAPSPEPVVVASPALLERHGEEVFRRTCNACHPGGGRGLGPALTRPIERASAIDQVRLGFGEMPPFTIEQLSDAELDAVLAYLETIRRRGASDQDRAANLVRMIESLGWEPVLDSEADDLR